MQIRHIASLVSVVSVWWQRAQAGLLSELQDRNARIQSLPVQLKGL